MTGNELKERLGRYQIKISVIGPTLKQLLGCAEYAQAFPLHFCEPIDGVVISDDVL